MVYGFFKQSGGHVKIYSEPGLGTAIKLYLPRTLEKIDAVVPVDFEPVVGGTETILVAEDDKGVRATVIEILGVLGYRILNAKDAASALAIIESGMHIDLLFNDVVMPGTLRSPELARKAHECIRTNIAELLRDFGYYVIKSQNAAEALQALRDSPVDVLMTDLGLPGMSGMSGGELARRAREVASNIGVVFATGHGQLASRVANCVVLVKPYASSDIEQALRTVTERT